MSIKIKDVSKSFGEYKVLDNINLEVNSGELVALLGASGCGKTTLLRIIAGLENPDKGNIIFFDEDKTKQDVRNRKVGFVFQHYALFRHMTVSENIAFGLTVKPRSSRPSKKEIKEKVNSLLSLIQLEWAEDRYPNQLSGGQRQRVALARALAIEPKILLLDEPFGALDAKVRKELRKWVKKLHDEIHITSIFVTHDQDEALELSNRIVIMHKGKIEQIGTPVEVYENPATPFVYDFLGSSNKFNFKKIRSTLTNECDEQMIPNNDDNIVAFARPHEVQILKYNWPDIGSYIIKNINEIGSIAKVELKDKSSDHMVDVEITREEFIKLQLSINDSVSIRIRNMKIFNDYPIKD